MNCYCNFSHYYMFTHETGNTILYQYIGNEDRLRGILCRLEYKEFHLKCMFKSLKWDMWAGGQHIVTHNS